MKRRNKYEGLVIVLSRCDLRTAQMWTLQGFQGVRVYRRDEYDDRLRPLGPLPYFTCCATAAAHVSKHNRPVQVDLNSFLSASRGRPSLSFYCDVTPSPKAGAAPRR